MRLLVFLILISLVSADYTIGIYQIQPLQPEPGDTVVFKITVANEPRWASVMNARVISPDGRIFKLGNIRYVDRPGSDIAHSEYVSWEVPSDALQGNYTLEVTTPENVFLSTTFRIFRFPKLIYEEGLLKNVGYSTAREVEVRALPCEKCSDDFYQYLGDIEAGQAKRVEIKGNFTRLEVSYRNDKIYNASFPVTRERARDLSIRTTYENGTFSVFVNTDAEIEILREIPIKVKETQLDSETRFLPVRFKVLGQNVVVSRVAAFQILPEADFIEIPVRIRAEDVEKLVIWSGRVREEKEQIVIQPAQETFDFKLVALAAALLLIISASTAFWLKKGHYNI